MPPASPFPLLIPLCLVVAGALGTLALEPFLARRTKHALLPWLGAMALVGAGIAQWWCGAPGQLGGVVAMDGARMWLCLATIASAAIGLGGLQQSLSRDDYPGGEPYPLCLLAAAGAMLMVMACESIALFIGLELASLSVYALVGLRRHRLESNEALFKYLAMGAVFSAIFLYGAALTYGATGGTRLGMAVVGGRQAIFMLGQCLMLIGLLFKVGVVPFHFWSPDAYTGAPAAVTGFMGAVIKIGGFAALGGVWLNLVAIASGSHPGGVLPLDAEIAVSPGALPRHRVLILVLALLSLVLGNFSALKQTSARRMIAFSSVAHAGYMLLALALPSGRHSLQLGPLWFYLVGYSLATAGALASFAALSGREDAGDDLDALTGRGRARPFHGLVLTIFLASFAGVPPTAGFLGKYLVFSGLVAQGHIGIAVAAMVVAVVGAAFYLRFVVALWSPAGATDSARSPSLGCWTIGAAALATIALVIAPNLVATVTAAVPVALAR